MSSSIARRREAKAKRRKQVLAERRRQADAESEGSLVRRVQRSALAPIESCRLQKGLFDTGMGAMVLARGTASTGLIMATFLLDVFCLGVKDVWLREMEASELEEYVAAMETAAPLEDVDPAYARKLLREAVAYGRSLGFEPPRDYKAAERLFGDVCADASDARFEFGCDGKPLYVSGPNDTPAQVRRRLEQLRRSRGEDGFDFVLGEGEDDDDSDLAADDGSFEGYDPDVAPNPGEWLELDEDERILQIEAFHRRAGVLLADAEAHAIFHLAVENQIALGDSAVVGQTLNRLMTEGLDRHEAIHAIGSLIAEQFHQAFRGSESISAEDYASALGRLTADSWRALTEEEEGVEEP